MPARSHSSDQRNRIIDRDVCVAHLIALFSSTRTILKLLKTEVEQNVRAAERAQTGRTAVRFHVGRASRSYEKLNSVRLERVPQHFFQTFCAYMGCLLLGRAEVPDRPGG
eukprot:7945658-Alexandrium_andersonii.AAC.1